MKIEQLRMIQDIEAEVMYTRSMIGKDKLDTHVMHSMAIVPRDEFVPYNMRSLAFENGPLPIGHGQTISQPYIVALMTDLLAIKRDHHVLEIGTGCGYQTAILSTLCKQVYTVEVVPELGEEAAERLKNLGYKNVECHIGNGYHGWPEHAPYDGIIVTAAATHIPEPLVEQLKPGGVMVIPVGLPFAHQELMRLEKDADGNTRVDSILGVAFVPLVGGLPEKPEEQTESSSD
ncbi:MAG: protein-L-isoaspartate(D-aspartate) O-methyltransferase [Chromatiales bacterium]|jgi:protein-L-isoaspartate(D-aspartate) O-methyltransferase